MDSTWLEEIDLCCSIRTGTQLLISRQQLGAGVMARRNDGKIPNAAHLLNRFMLQTLTEQLLCFFFLLDTSSNSFTYRFMATGTVEEKIFQRQLSKEGLQSVVDDKAQVNELSTKDLKNLFKVSTSVASSSITFLITSLTFTIHYHRHWIIAAWRNSQWHAW